MNKKEREELYASFEHLLNGEKRVNVDEDCEIINLDENMKLLRKSVSEWWKPILLFDCNDKTATKFMDPEELTLLNVEDKDIDWNSLKGVSQECIDRAKSRIAYFPTNIRGFINGIAEVEWQLSPDGNYYMDEEGFGMTDDKEVVLLGQINRAGKIVQPFKLRRH